MKRRNRKSQQKRKPRHTKPSRTRRAKRIIPKRGPVRNKKLPPPIKTADPRVARALGLMRREGLSASEAARRQGMKLGTFVRGAGTALYQSGPGKPWAVRPDDKLAFLVNIPTLQGPKAVAARNLRERKLAGTYDSFLRMWREGRKGAEAKLKKLEGKTVGGYTLITDPKLLTQLEEAGLLDFDSLYVTVGGRS